MVHFHQIESYQRPPRRVGPDLNLGENPVLDGAHGHDICRDAGLLQRDLQLLVAIPGLLHKRALIVHILGHIHDHPGVVGAGPVPDAKQGQPVFKSAGRINGLFRSGLRLRLRRRGRYRFCIRRSRGLHRPAALDSRQQFTSVRDLVPLGVGVDDGLENLGGLHRVLGLLQPDKAHAEQGVVRPPVFRVRGQHALVGLKSLLPICPDKRAPGQLLVAPAKKKHGPGRILSLGIARQGPLKRLRDRFPFRPQPGPFFIGQQRIKGAHSARVLVFGRSKSPKGKAQHQRQGKSDSMQSS
jgi:hypothetical protein